MKKRNFLKFIFLSLLVMVLFIPAQGLLAEEDSFICAVYLTGVGCPHCAKTDPVILEDLPREYLNLVIIEYEIYQQRTNAFLVSQYNEEYDSGLGIPLILFNKYEQEIGGSPILRNIRKIIDSSKSNNCPLIDGSSIDFDNLDITSLPGFPKIWHQEKILIKTGSRGDNELLKELLFNDNLNEILEGMEFEEIQSLRISLSGKYVGFENAIKVGDWIFQWNGKGLGEIPIEESSTEEEPMVEEEPLAESQPELTLAKVISLAVVDAINPCALAVLGLMLIAILTYNPAKKRNILLAGLAFVIAVFLMYLIYGLIIIKSFQLIQALTLIRLWLYRILGFGAIILGCFKLRDFLRAKRVCKTNPRVNRIISKITNPKGAFWVGAFVTIFLLPCTIGPYIICCGILSPLAILKVFPLLLLYNLIFILPMLVVVLIIYFGLSKIEDVSSWQARNIKYLDLISGLVILVLGVAMVLGLV